jgi:hypothetical protein
MDPIEIFSDPPAGYQTGIRLYGHGLPGNAMVVGEFADTPGTITAHFAPAAVRIIKMQPEIRTIGIANCHKTIGTGFSTQFHSHFSKVKILFGTTGINDHEVVACAAHV